MRFPSHSNIKYGKLRAKESEEIPWNKLCLYLIDTYVMRKNGKKSNLNIKVITSIDPVKEWFEIMQYDYKTAISISNLVETTWLSIYSIQMKIIYDQGS